MMNLKKVEIVEDINAYYIVITSIQTHKENTQTT